MMKFAAILSISILVATACKEQSHVIDIQLSDLKDHNMKILPSIPTVNDEIKLVVFDDCTYNVLSGVSRTENIIDIRKQFNGMMKWPCVIKNDTILIGKLPEGIYTVNYKLVDIARTTGDPNALYFSFQLSVIR